VPPIAVAFIFYLVYHLPDDERSEVYALSFICGGAVGNYIDRLRFGYVIDFLDFHIQEKYSWPAFNVADIAIVCGVAFLIYKMFRQPKPATEKGSDKTE
jgi:signal peptidase II